MNSEQQQISVNTSAVESRNKTSKLKKKLPSSEVNSSSGPSKRRKLLTPEEREALTAESSLKALQQRRTCFLCLQDTESVSIPPTNST